MSIHWLTIASPTTEAMVNPLLAACEAGHIPDTVRILANPTIRDDIEPVEPFFEMLVTEHGGNPSVEVHSVSAETAFDEIVAFFQAGIEDVGDDTTVAVDITPGRKFMSAIAFQAGIRFGADHVFYLLLDSNEYYGQVYADIPHPAVDLIDFTEVV